MPVFLSPLTLALVCAWFVFRGTGVDLKTRKKKKKEQTQLCPTQFLLFQREIIASFNTS